MLRDDEDGGDHGRDLVALGLQRTLTLVAADESDDDAATEQRRRKLADDEHTDEDDEHAREPRLVDHVAMRRSRLRRGRSDRVLRAV